MTQDIEEHLRRLTSRKGRYWLRDSQGGSAESSGEDLPFSSAKISQVDDRAPSHESVVVSIPNVAALNAKAAGIANTQIVAPKRNVHAMPPAPQPETIAALAPAISRVVTPAFSELDVQELPVGPPPAAQLNVKAVPAAPLVETKTSLKSDDAVEAARAMHSKKSSDSIVKIADEIIAKHPIASSSVIMLAGSQASMHADETCARVAAELASRQLGRVLLIDSDFVDRRLTKASGMNSQGGLSEIMNIAFPWEKAILKSGSSKLDFMAAGSCPHKRWTPKETLREAIAEIRCEYKFVCVSVGDAHSSAGALWSELSDGAFLVVSATQSSDSIAESAVQQLKSKGARLGGCIVADVPAEKSVA